MTAPFEVPRARSALLIIDMISDFQFPEGSAVLTVARRIVSRITALKARAAQARIPAIYVNDNLGRWRSDVQALLSRCTGEKAKGRDVVQRIAPARDDFILLKPKQSCFYATPLAELLQAAGAKHVILTGLSTHQCILFTANDAYLRNFKLSIPGDCVGAPDRVASRFALRYFTTVLKADVRPSTRLQLARS